MDIDDTDTIRGSIIYLRCPALSSFPSRYSTAARVTRAPIPTTAPTILRVSFPPFLAGHIETQRPRFLRKTEMCYFQIKLIIPTATFASFQQIHRSFCSPVFWSLPHRPFPFSLHFQKLPSSFSESLSRSLL